MRRTIANLAAALLSFLPPHAFHSLPADGALEGQLPRDILPFRDVKAGMKGTGRTVFRAGQIEEFQVEVLGKLENIGPDQNMILCKLGGGPLEETGVLEGMSGSPVYIDGKMIGAVSSSWGFSRTPIAGITPIEEMLAIDSARLPAAAGAPAWVTLPKALRSPSAALLGSELVNHYRLQAASLFSISERNASGLRPLATPIAFAGFPTATIARLSSSSSFSAHRSGGGAHPMETQGSASSEPESSPLQPGSAIGVALVRGDLQATAIGTVTRIDGDRILAFGHPLFGLGSVELPMTRARVEALLPSFQSSLKLAVEAGAVGIVTADRASGIAGRIGPAARTIPVRVEVSPEGGASRIYAFEIADHPLLAPILVFLALGGLLDTSQGGAGDVSVELEEGSVIRVSGDRKISLGNLFAGDEAVSIASATIAFISQLILENEFEPARIEGINLLARTTPRRRLGRITSAWCDRTRAHPGEEVTVLTSLKPYREPERIVSLAMEIPPEIEPGRLTLTVGDALALHRTESEGVEGFMPRDLDHMIDLINSVRRSEKIYVLATREEPSVWIRDRALPNLPPSKAAVLLSPQARGNFPLLRSRPVFEKSVGTDYSIEGYRRLEIEILP